MPFQGTWRHLCAGCDPDGWSRRPATVTAMAGATRGFFGRGRSARDPRLPPGQYDAGEQWPVLTAEVTPRLATESWTFTVEGLVEQPDDVDLGRDPRACPRRRYGGDIHCVTTWSKLGVTFTGVSVDTLLEVAGPLPRATHVIAFSHTGYTTNLPLADVTGGKAWVVWDFEGQPLADRARRPGPAAGPAPVLLEERQVGGRPAPARPRRARLLGAQRLPRPRRPLARAALPGGLTAGRAGDGSTRAVADGHASSASVTRRQRQDLPAGPGPSRPTTCRGSTTSCG